MTQKFASRLALAAAAATAVFGLSAGLTTAASAQDAEALAKSRGCLACHAPAAKKIGPSYKDIAAKYQGDAAAPAMLAAKIQKGGSGNWGKVPMPPNPRIDDAAAKTLVTWILATK